MIKSALNYYRLEQISDIGQIRISYWLFLTCAISMVLHHSIFSLPICLLIYSLMKIRENNITNISFLNMAPITKKDFMVGICRKAFTLFLQILLLSSSYQLITGVSPIDMKIPYPQSQFGSLFYFFYYLLAWSIGLALITIDMKVLRILSYILGIIFLKGIIFIPAMITRRSSTLQELMKYVVTSPHIAIFIIPLGIAALFAFCCSIMIFSSRCVGN